MTRATYSHEKEENKDHLHESSSVDVARRAYEVLISAVGTGLSSGKYGVPSLLPVKRPVIFPEGNFRHAFR